MEALLVLDRRCQFFFFGYAESSFWSVDSLCLAGIEEDAIAAYEKGVHAASVVGNVGAADVACFVVAVTCHEAFERETVWSYTRMTRAMLPRFQRGVSFVETAVDTLTT